MNCLFCRNIPIGVATLRTTHAICTKCVTRYRFGGGTIQAYAISGRYKNEWYAAEFKITEPKHFILYKEDNDPDKKAGANEWGGKELLKLEYLPKIDCHNLEEKIPMLLVFS